MTSHFLQLALCLTCLAVTISVTDAATRNATYDPLKGSYLESFQNPSGKLNCSLYFASRTMFLIGDCNSSDSFVKGLSFTFSNITIPRLVYTSFGVLLEVAEIDWDNYNDPLILNITSDDPKFYKSISIVETKLSYQYFTVPSFRAIGRLDGPYSDSADNSILMNTKMLVIFFLKFENFYGCDAYFWVGKGKKPDKNGKKIPDENGSLKPLKNYYKKTIVLKLPQIDLDDPTSPEMTIYDIDYLGIYCPDTDHVYSYLTFDLHMGGSYGYIEIQPPFIFDKFFIGEEMVLCLPNGTYSREINLDDTKSELPCLGGSSSLVANGLLSLITVVALVASVLFLNLES